MYRIGDIGPGGGIVFYDKGSYANGWRYIEAAQNELHTINGVSSIDAQATGYAQGKKTFEFGFVRQAKENVMAGTSDGMGAGLTNTTTLVSFSGKAAFANATTLDTVKTESYAAKLCQTLTAGGYSDWYLPSAAEASLMVQVLRRSQISVNECWTSTEQDGMKALSVKADASSNGSNMNFLLSVRAIRRF